MVASRMGVLVQIRDVPEDVHRTLKSRAAASGKTLSQYLREVLAANAARPTVEELRARIDARGRVDPPVPSEQIIREIRDRGE